MNAIVRYGGALALYSLGGTNLWREEARGATASSVVVLDEDLPASTGASAQGHDVESGAPVTVYFTPRVGHCGALEAGDACSTTRLLAGATVRQFVQRVASVCICR